jgi:nucleoside 2-deoxyribosyltransferase
MRRRIYLAGPDVFRPDAKDYGAHLKRLCQAHGFEGCFPLDEPAQGSADIFAACLRQLRACDLVLANLSPFRGASADVGTAVELGMAHAMGKPVFAWSSTAGETYAARATRHADGWQVEDFGLTDNLMLVEALAAPVFLTPEAALAAMAK